MVRGAARLRRRFILVVGKGGVGKTTTAGALALALADGGEDVRLLSTDPAHSLADLFGTSPLRAPRASPCTPRLVLEELDASSRAGEWIDRSRGDLLDLLDAGTYLDRGEAEAFLDLSLPGVDELAATLRLTDLAAGDAARIVVDTAPSGHTLRLLESGDLLRGWVEALEAVAQKGDAVVGQLTRGRGRAPGAGAVEELEERRRVFAEEVLGDAEAVVVTRSGHLEEAETGRLRAALEDRGVPVAFVAVTGGVQEDGDAGAPDEDRDAGGPEGAASGADVPVIGIPWREGLSGCEGLRAWGEPPGKAEPAAGGAGGSAPGVTLPERSGPPRAAVREILEAPSLLLFAGKGGVGKSTCAAAAALGLAEGRPTTLLSTDPAPSLSDLLGREATPGGFDVEALRVRQVDAPAAFGSFRERYRDRVEEVFRALGITESARLDRQVMSTLMNLAPPGVDEVFALTALLEEEGAERIVVDPAPTGHFLRLLAAPELVLGWVRELLRVLSRFRAVLDLDTVTGELLAFARQLKGLHGRLTDPGDTGVVVVTAEGVLVEAETERLLASLEAAGVPVVSVLRNRARGTGASSASSAVASGPAGPDPSVARRGRHPRIRAPFVDPPPRGASELHRFLAAWEVEG